MLRGVTLATACAVPLACSASGGARSDASGESSAGGAAAGGAAGAGQGGAPTGGSGGTSFGGTGGAIQVDGGSEDARPLDAACAGLSVQAEGVPLDMYVMVDSTGSMGDDCNVGDTTASKWCYTINALDGFFEAPTSAGMGVALKFFNSAKSLLACDGLLYSSPDVPLGEIPGNVPALVDAMNLELPIGTTPTEPALRGLVQFTAAHQRPGRKMVAVIVTDGSPNSCNDDSQFLRSIVHSHFTATGIQTYVVGMEGSRYDELEIIAEGGGVPPNSKYCSFWTSSPCHYYDVGNGDPQAFIDALQHIQATAIGCEFDMPEPLNPSEVVDPKRINVELEKADGSVHPLGKVSDAASCVPGAWHYDDDASPTKIILCPESCDAVKNEPAGELRIEMGCATRPPIPA